MQRAKPCPLVMKRVAFACASLLAVACASSEEAAKQEPQAMQQARPYQGDGTPEIETEQEAKDVAQWFLRGRGLLGEKVEVETTALERDRLWQVLIVVPGSTHCSVEIARSGYSTRMSPGR